MLPPNVTFPSQTILATRPSSGVDVGQVRMDAHLLGIDDREGRQRFIDADVCMIVLLNISMLSSKYTNTSTKPLIMQSNCAPFQLSQVQISPGATFPSLPFPPYIGQHGM